MCGCTWRQRILAQSNYMSHFAGIGVRGVRLLTVTSGCWPFSCKLELYRASWTEAFAEIICGGTTVVRETVWVPEWPSLPVTALYSFWNNFAVLSCSLLTPVTWPQPWFYRWKKVRLQGFNYKDMDLLTWNLDVQGQHIYGLTYELEYSGHYQWAHSLPWSESLLTNDSLGKESSPFLC